MKFQVVTSPRECGLKVATSIDIESACEDTYCKWSEGRGDNSSAKFVEGTQMTAHRKMHAMRIMILGLFEGRAWLALSFDCCELSAPSVLRKLPRRMRPRESG